jgi:hypothetical protein
VPDDDKTIQLEHGQGANQFLMGMAQRSQFRFQGRKEFALQNASERRQRLV